MIPFILIGWLLTIAVAVWLGWRLYKLRKTPEKPSMDELEIERTINYFSTSLFGRNTVDEILWDITKNCISHLNFEDCVVYLLDKERNIFIQKAAYGPKNPKSYEILQPIEIPMGQGIVGTVGLTGKAEIIKDTTLEPRYIVDDERRFSEITVPIIYQDKVLGIIDSEHNERNFFKDKHLRILTTIASLCANKIMRLQAEQAYREAEVKLHDNNRKIAENRLAALRMQMNPHFIFNSLNSINNFISKNDNRKASTYLSKFSRLIRHIFDNAKAEWIPLEKEIKALELYLELEKLRFDNKFDLMINVSESINLGTVLVPPLLIQPFVENAIWHGLLHKDNGSGELSISYWKNGERLYVSVEDNGIGRTASGELRAGKILTQEKRGLKITDERIHIMNEMFGAGIQYTISDLVDEHGNSAGTRVEMYMTVKELLVHSS
jgi:putative methionine-R-sulfoxide reductase with GAF domain